MNRNRRPESRSRGIALILTLVIAFFLVALLGAFLVVHRGNSSLTVSGRPLLRKSDSSFETFSMKMSPL